MVWIAGQSFSAGSTNVFAMTNIPQTFTHLQLRFYSRDNNPFSSFDNLFIRLNNDFGPNYSYHWLQGDGSNAYSNSGVSQTFLPVGVNPSASATANVYGCAIVDILDYRNTNKYKTVRAIGGVDANGSGFASLNSGAYMSTAAITSFEASGQNSGGYISAGSRVDLYGITSSQVTGA